MSWGKGEWWKKHGALGMLDEVFLHARDHSLCEGMIDGWRLNLSMGCQA